MNRLWHNASLMTLEGRDLSIVEDGAVACEGGVIAYAGPRAGAPNAAETIDCEGRWISPGLVDCHTHLVYAGNRAREFELRLQGASYEEIARAGGGIVSTMKATRTASENDLVAASLPRLDALMAEGVTTVEIKSGYGLSMEAERTQLRAARRLAELRSVTITTTFLGAHTLPPEFAERDAYVAHVCETMLPTLAAESLVDAVDAFCEGIGALISTVSGRPVTGCASVTLRGSDARSAAQRAARSGSRAWQAASFAQAASSASSAAWLSVENDAGSTMSGGATPSITARRTRCGNWRWYSSTALVP